jgi:site-specific recombinase XerD
MIRALPGKLQGVRDRALLLMGFAGGFRRAELAQLAVEDVARDKDGLVVTLRRSKTDREGQGRRVALPYGARPETCPVRA